MDVMDYTSIVLIGIILILVGIGNGMIFRKAGYSHWLIIPLMIPLMIPLTLAFAWVYLAMIEWPVERRIRLYRVLLGEELPTQEDGPWIYQEGIEKLAHREYEAAATRFQFLIDHLPETPIANEARRKLQAMQADDGSFATQAGELPFDFQTLMKVTALRDTGILTEEEFKRIHRQIIQTV